MRKLFFILILPFLLLAKSDNCTFKNSDYEDICKKAVNNGVSYEYANNFLLSYFKTKKFDEVSYKYLQPQYIAQHKKNEKKANNTLVKYVSEMVVHLREYKEVYDFVEKEYGVNREIITAILIKETRLGKIKPSHDAFIVFNTLVLRVKPNSQREKWLLEMGKTNMISIIIHCYKRGVAPLECNLPSSYAGAIGIPQFMPNSFVYAKGYKTEIGDLTKMEDSIVSVANFLNQKAEFTSLLDWNKVPDIVSIESKWYDFEFENSDASFVYASNKKGDKLYKCFTCDNEELDYLRDYTKKIMSYNNSSNYAIGVMRLAYEAQRELLLSKNQ
ncbi:Membrane-bound lytic murein transglycosylase B-like protein [Sulfurimonas denitrificans DSM 1251]|uniref:Membrane-bound lytic murein transglycosylase B-like protein n=1 Tax=Sulfurimonas denitrificans (strain ATCC 33889 / DSM 1251) TaxID=326298 RepID=Q30NT3_SULDN|nr:lytic murein transglycosylase [Sulfurimonas denitrificans]ABB45348.1 Membrane-bound lytic murein transglycosylase B-like protein [Sulfurimonas denitrificans DSM 1251]MDD3442602.1 lytic murein transglycosylase [Sulfurimonas denitrificans]